MYTCMYIYIYIYVYVERERERGRESTAQITANLRTKILDFGGFGSMRNLDFQGWSFHVHREFPGNVESTNLSRDNLSRAIVRSQHVLFCGLFWVISIYIYTYIYIYISLSLSLYTYIYIYIYMSEIPNPADIQGASNGAVVLGPAYIYIHRCDKRIHT